jgi:glutamate racemase
MKIGVFDSGIGGLSMAKAIQQAVPEDEVLLREDKKHVPYGTRSPTEILGFVTPIFQELIDDGCQVIVVACNTVSTTLIEDLRQRFSVPLVAVEPMIKPAAALTRNKVITVCATPTTLASARYAWLKATYTDGITVLEPDCSDWPRMIEHQQVDHQKIADRISETLEANADVIVLACTHYHWIEEEIVAIAAGKATVLQPEQAVIEQLKQVLSRLA